MKAPIRIINESFDLLGEIEDYESFVLTRRWHKAGEFDLSININKRNTEFLQKGNVIFIGNRLDTGGVIMHKEIALSDTGTASETMLVKGLSLQGYANRRITIPPDGHASETYAAQNVETIMRSLVNNHLVDPTDTDRAMPFLSLADNENKGDNINFASRYKQLEEELESLSTASGLGWGFVLDFDTSSSVFNVLEGVDRTFGNGVNPQALFSPDFDNIRSQQLTDSDFGLSTWALVAGQGEGADRAAVTVGEGEGSDRFEMFVDARDLEDAADLPDRGELRLLEMQGVLTLEAQAVPRSGLVYRQDYDLGDMVTVKNSKWGILLNSRITEAIEIYDSRGFDLQLVFGSSVPTLAEIVRRRIAQHAGAASFS